MFFSRKKKILTQLQSSFGRLKTEGFNFKQIARYSDRKTSDAQKLNDQTCHDLDFDLFFCFADRTSSKVGQQYLYNRLKTIDYHPEKFEHQERVVEYLNNHPEKRLQLQYELNKLNNQQAYYIPDLFQKEIESKPKWAFIFPLLSVLAIASLVASFFNPSYVLILLGVIPINVLIHYGLKRKTNVFLNSIPALLTLGTVAKKLFKNEVLKGSSLDIESSINTISSIRRKMSFFKLDQKVDSDMEAAYWFMIELIKITFLIEPLLLYNSVDQLRDKSADIETVYEFVGEIDSFLSIASLREGLDSYCIPDIQETASNVHFEGLLHPLVNDCVANSINTSKSILLTGSNMSGKTTFIRAIGLNYIAGMTMNTCFATSAVLPVAQLFTVIRIEDDLMSSSSYFNKEVSEIKQIIDRTENSPSIILLDELFKGTNTLERIAAAKAVLSYVNHAKAQVFVSTHDLELTKLLNEDYALYHFSESIIDETIHFDYQLKKGVASAGNAIKILEINDYPSKIVSDANDQLTSQTKHQ